jgi:hypothetical protein
VGGGCEIIAASGKDRDKKKKKKNTSSSGKKQGEGGGSRKAAATPKGNVWSKDFTDRTSSSNARDSQSDTRQKITSGFKNSRDTKEAKSSRLENETRRGGLRLLETSYTTKQKLRSLRKTMGFSWCLEQFLQRLKLCYRLRFFIFTFLLAPFLFVCSF